jgi:tetratricopeptide (TPR) repeat protein
MNDPVRAEGDDAGAHCERANALFDLHRYQEAIASYDNAIALEPAYMPAWRYRGLALIRLARFDEAAGSCARALALEPKDAEAHAFRGNALHALGRFEEALESFDRAIALQPRYAEAHQARGLALFALKKAAEAVASFDRAIAINPGFATAWCYRGNALMELDRWEEAQLSYDRAAQAGSGFAAACVNRGTALTYLGRLEEAIAAFSHAITLSADLPVAYYGRAVARLLAGRLEEAWIDHERRWQALSIGTALAAGQESLPLWLGEESPSGRTILLYGEQGLGDTIQLCRYARLVAELGAKVYLQVQEPLVDLLTGLAGVAAVFPAKVAVPPCDYRCPLMSLPLVFKTTLATIPSSARYLSSDPARVARWRARLGERRALRVGLAWSGSATYPRDHQRSIALATLMRYLPAGPQYVSLQTEVRADDRQTLRSYPELLEEPGDFADTAALCECLDLVVSVDTSMVHLGAALGKRTWVLLPFAPDWRWMMDRTDSPWYPSVTLYRQRTPGDWEGVLVRVGEALARLAPGSTSSAD